MDGVGMAWDGDGVKQSRQDVFALHSMIHILRFQVPHLT
jgi:hypothetical protein